MNIVLIGTIGAGKTAVGKAISEMSEFKFVGTDEVAYLKFLTRNRRRNAHPEYWNVLINSERNRIKSMG